MENKNNNMFNACNSKSGSCSFQFADESLSCIAGGGDCRIVLLLEAEESDFHDSRLIEATRAIKEIVAKIPPDENGRNLSFIHTNMGTLLAWVEHGEEPIARAITAKSGDAEVAAALKLKNVKLAEAVY